MRDTGVVWGKWDSAGPPYPLIAHALDTAAFALALWDQWLSRPARQALESAGIQSGSQLALVAGVHDCGKADPWFVGQLGSRRRQEFQDNLELLRAGGGLPRLVDEAGFVARVASRDRVIRRILRHEAMSGHALEREGYPPWVSAAVSGHHGRYQPDVDFPARRFAGRHRAWIDTCRWSDEQRAVVTGVRLSLGLDGLGGLPESVDGALIPLVTGLVCLADWSASDEDFVTCSDLELLVSDPVGYLTTRTAQARSRLPATIGVPTRPTGTFQEVFAGLAPTRDVQRWAVDSVSSHDPALTVIAVPMGEGKTETALWMHAATEAHDGLVFALPTTATADAMFDRIQAFYAGTPALAALRHGSALLNAFYDDAAADPVGVCDAGATGGLSGSEWLRGRHRSLTAPVTVSTCDQVLAAAVDHRFLPVRLVSLANKHVVLDEVHTYDPYQDALLTRLLGWLGRYRTRVTLLSATLPTRRVNDYARAYARGAGTDADPVAAEYPAVTQLHPGAVAPVTTRLVAHRAYHHQVHGHHLVVPAESYAAFQSQFAAGTARYVDDLVQAHPLARVAVIVNTVGRAVRLARLLDVREPLVLHSRMTAQQRAGATQRLLTAAGPGAGPGGLLLVATQVAEASLDIDFDILITDLAPMTSLLQRMGRQWRHSMPTAGGWVHPPTSVRDQAGPTVHVLIGSDEGGVLHPHACLPYTQAEVSRTLTVGLGEGQRDTIAIPGDLQTLVDACDISLADLTSDADAQALVDLTAHLGRAADAAGQAQRVGTDVSRLSDGWQHSPDWSANPQLAGLTEPSLWDADAVTRLRDAVSVLLLVLDPAAATRWAYPGTADEIMSRALTRPDIVAVLGCAVQVNGALASRLKAEAPPPDGWWEQPTAVLRSTHPVTVARLRALGLTLDPSLGLVEAR